MCYLYLMFTFVWWSETFKCDKRAKTKKNREGGKHFFHTTALVPIVAGRGEPSSAELFHPHGLLTPLHGAFMELRSVTAAVNPQNRPGHAALARFLLTGSSTPTPASASLMLWACNSIMSQDESFLPAPGAQAAAGGVLEPRSRSRLGVLVTGVLGGSLLALYAGAAPFVAPALRKVCLPFVPATTTQVENVLRVLRTRSGSLVDIGSGDGRIVSAFSTAERHAEGLMRDAHQCNICSLTQ